MVYDDEPYLPKKVKLNLVSDCIYLICNMKECPERITGNQMK